MKATSAITKEFIKAASSHISRFLKRLLSIFHRYTVSTGFQDPIHTGTSGFQTLMISGFLNSLNLEELS
jgi:hypothetical protein